MNETTRRIKELRDEVERLSCEIRELERKNSNYYIGVYTERDGGDYDIDYYCLLGFISEEQAKSWAEDMWDGDIYNTRYFEVSKEIYDKFGDWRELYKLQTSINRYRPAINKLEGIDRFEETLNRAITDLTKEIGIEDLSFMYPEI